MQRVSVVGAMVAAALIGCPLQTAKADDTQSPWQVRVRALAVLPASSGSTVNVQGVPALSTPNSGLSIGNSIVPELDISYYFTPNVAAELILGVTPHNITGTGALANLNIGRAWLLPPTLLAQYHFTQLGALKPYVGLGLNYTNISKVHFTPGVVAALHPSLDHSSFGLALQAGVDYEIAKNVYVNLDVKHVDIETDVKSSGAKVGKFKVDPWLIGVGVGYRF